MVDQKEYKRQWYIRNKEKVKKNTTQWRNDNSEKVKQYKLLYYQKNRGIVIERSKQWWKDNPGKFKMIVKRWRLNNPEYAKQWRENNLEYIREYQNRYNTIKRKTDLKFNLNSRMSNAIGIALNKNKKGRHWENLVGYNLKDLYKRLIQTMPEGYAWQDYLNGRLHIDHIIPISVFNFTKSEHTDFKRCWALENLQLLPARENRSKHNKLYKPFQPALLF